MGNHILKITSTNNVTHDVLGLLPTNPWDSTLFKDVEKQLINLSADNNQITKEIF